MLIGGGLALAVLVAALLAGGAAAPRLLGWGLRTVGARVVAALPPGASPQQRQELRRAFECVASRAEAGELEEERVGALSRACNDALADRQLSQEELERVRAMLLALCPRELRR